MEMSNDIIKQAIEACEKEIRNGKRVCNESDFERLLANCIDTVLGRDEELKKWEVHTQIYYNNKEYDYTHKKGSKCDNSGDKNVIKYYVDILLMQTKGIDGDTKDEVKKEGGERKEYREKAYAIELKYIRKNESNYVNNVVGDWKKANNLSNTTLWSVVLCDKEKANEESKVREKFEHFPTTKCKELHCAVLYMDGETPSAWLSKRNNG